MAFIFHNDMQEGAHTRFQRWRKRNPKGFFINRRTTKDGLLHRSNCPHPGGTHWREEDEGASLTAKMKICAPSVGELVEWAKKEKVRLDRCLNCNPVMQAKSPKTYLVTWNPKKRTWHDLDKQHKDSRVRGFADLDWKCKHSGVQRGDRVFLMRQGVEPRGIMASGFALSGTYEGYYDSVPKEKATFISIRWDTILHPDQQQIFPREALGRPDLVDMHWDTETSGISIPLDVAAALESRWARFLAKHGIGPVVTPDEITTPEKYWEGAVKQVTVNAYERNPSARKACIDHYGTTCVICDVSFAEVYGVLGEDFIHVHHVKPLSSVGREYVIDPVKHLRPVCPNCHAMVHLGGETRTIERMRKIVRRGR